MDDFAFVQTGPASALAKAPKASAAEDDETEEPEPTPRPKTTPTPTVTRTPRTPRAGDTPEPRETAAVLSRVSATRTKPLPHVNSDGIETTEEPQAREVVFLQDRPDVIQTNNFAWLAISIVGGCGLLALAWVLKDPIRDYLNARRGTKP
jgi:hypothetical protein